MEGVTLMALGTTIKYIVKRRSIGVVAISPSLITKDDCHVVWMMSKIAMVDVGRVQMEKPWNCSTT